MGMLSKCVMYATVSLSGEVDILADLRSILSMFRHSLLSLHMMIACTQRHRRLETERKIRTYEHTKLSVLMRDRRRVLVLVVVEGTDGGRVMAA